MKIGDVTLLARRLPSGRTVYLADDLRSVVYTTTVACFVEDVPDVDLRREVLALVGEIRSSYEDDPHG
jgi:hypothetical protein